MGEAEDNPSKIDISLPASSLASYLVTVCRKRLLTRFIGNATL
jgi:hypothetical protein